MANLPSTTQEGIVDIELPEPICGSEEGRTQVKTLEKSKAHFVDALEPYVKKSMFMVQDTLDNLEVKVDNLEGEYANFTIATKALIQD